MKTLYYLVFAGTNDRILCKDGSPIMVDEDALPSVMLDKQRMVGDRDLQAMTLLEYNRAFGNAKRSAKAAAYTEWAGEEE